MKTKVKFTPKVTAIVTSYNHARFLRKRIESIQKQTYKDIELIVIDDCSPDDSDVVIREMQQENSFIYLRTPKNSGSPFGSWQQALEHATGDYIWICESDDYCTEDFIETAVNAFSKQQHAVLYYCGSHVVDENDSIIGHSNDFFHEIWREERWDTSFKSDGMSELIDFQVRGQTVPNLSSAVFSAAAFRNALGSDLTAFKLTGDWLFVGRVMTFGSVLFNSEAKNFFREHQNTARVRVNSAMSQAEFIITKAILFHLSGLPLKQLSTLLGTDAIRFVHLSDKWYEVIRKMLAISIWKTLRVVVLLVKISSIYAVTVEET